MNFYEFETIHGKALINLDTVTDMRASPNNNEFTRLYLIVASDFYIEVKEKFENMVGMFGRKKP